MAREWTDIYNRVPAGWTSAQTDTFGPSWPCSRISPSPTPSLELPKIVSCTVPLLESQFTILCDTMEASTSGSPFVILDSAAAPGRFSVIGCLHQSSIRISYSIANTYVTVIDDKQTHREPLEDRDVWTWLASFMRSRRFTGGDPSIPFWGGLVGVLSYELGAYELDPQTITLPPTSDSPSPDVNLVYVERSLVFDRKAQRLHIQSSLPHDGLWISKTATMVSQLDVSLASLEASREESTSTLPNFILPDKATYISRIQQCQEYLAAGDSYELCLTARTHVTLPSNSQYNSSWELYKSARRRNPAPYSAYLRLSPLTLISTSPERFLSYSRPPHTVCQLRPIKGTIRKSPHVDRAAAERTLAGSVKEVAENLMIVDLIRHDLHGVVGPDVHVPYFCTVEEYETVWQMVSVIEGQLSTDASELKLDSEEGLGWEVLRRSLPPGSMTGAPKKRSVEILRTLEDDQRGVYSGVFGYWDVGGGGDWAVTIRSCFKYDMQMGSDVHDSHGDVWTIGAGGAITALSDPEAEWEEMMLKLQGVLRAFE
jgi:para-aminobenzoate synthetase